MSQIHAMSDDQVANELRKMTAFIRQEALEKAREIQLKADEEFAIEKASLVRTQTDAIDAEYTKKFKQASMTQQITQSTLANKSRLQILSARQELLNELFEEARGKLSEARNDQDKYVDVLKRLLLEGLYALNDKIVRVRCRKDDQDSVKRAVDGAREEYKEKMKGGNVDIKVDEENNLPEDSAGGITVLDSSGKIDINNTFGERLRLLEQDALPTVREILFGENKNRKFKD